VSCSSAGTPDSRTGKAEGTAFSGTLTVSRGGPIPSPATGRTHD
jgi:hypothetical protein